MNKLNITKSIIALASLAVLSGCAAVHSPHVNMDNTVYESTSEVNANSELKNNVSLEEVKDFKSSSTSAGLNNETAREAITKSLKSADLLSLNDNGRFELSAYLIDADDAGLFIETRNQMTGFDRNIIVNYSLYDTENKYVVYKESITGSGVNDYEDATIFGFYDHVRVAGERAYNDNFRQLIEGLKNL